MTAMLTALTAAQYCSNYQVRLGGECVDCDSVLFGCSQCKVMEKDFFNFTAEPVLQCTACDYGMFLLSFDNEAFQRTSDANPKRLSTCVHRCEDFAHNYVSNPSTMRCEYCGENCTECTLQYGCTKCSGNSFKQHATARQYSKNVLNGQTARWPYSFNEYTDFRGPSSEFAVCVDCDKVDPRCDDCRPVPDPPAPDPEELEFGEPAPVAKVVDKTRTCSSCHEWVQSREQQEANGGYCNLYSAIGSIRSRDECYQPLSDGTCEACRPGNYLNSTQQCVSCPSNFTAAAGCSRCTQNECLECLPGFVLFNRTCQACELTDYNRKSYSLLTQRCSQCQVNDRESCAHCDIGWQGSDFKYKTFLAPSLTKAESVEKCNLRCGET
jgi:hypothetical protein